MVQHLNERFAGQRDRKVFLACHKDVKHHADGHVLTFGKLSTAHFGAIDGKNLWADHSTAVIVGLPYRSRIWANNLYQAINGRQDTAWLQSNAEVRTKLEVKQLNTTICQAVNRVHCRATVDDKGNCKPTDVFIFLKDGPEGDAILEGLRTEMPGVVEEPWLFELDGPRASIRRRSSHEALITFSPENSPPEGMNGTWAGSSGSCPSRRPRQRTFAPFYVTHRHHRRRALAELGVRLRDPRHRARCALIPREGGQGDTRPRPPGAQKSN